MFFYRLEGKAVTILAHRFALERELEPSMLILGIEEQRQLRADMEAFPKFSLQPNAEGYPESYQGLVIVRVSAPALLMVGNVTVEQ